MSPLTDELLRRRLADRAAAAPEVSLAAIARSVVAQPRPRTAPIGFRMAILGPVAAVLVVAVAVGGGLLVRGTAPTGSGEPGHTEPAGSGRGAGSPGPAVPDAAAWRSLTWAETNPAAFDSDQTVVSDGIAVGDGFVAVGQTTADGVTSGRVWRSADGRAWERIDDSGLATLSPTRILAVDGTLVVLGWRAVGNTIGPAELWQSGDGRTWTRGPDLPVGADPSSAAGGDAGILVSSSRQSWVIPSDLSAFRLAMTWPEGALPGRAAWVGGRWVQPGTTGADANGEPSQAVVWTSPDGSSWTQQVVSDSGGGMFQVLAAARGLIAIGTSSEVCLTCRGRLLSTTAVWASKDGTSWRKTALPADVVPQSPSFEGDGRRIIAIGRDGAGSEPNANGRPMLSETLDGMTWTPIPLLGEAPTHIASVGKVVVGSHGVVMLPSGALDPAGRFTPHAWWAGAVVAEGSSPSTAPSAEPSPRVAGCDVLGFDVRRCTAVIARATEQVTEPSSIVATVVERPDPSGGVRLGGGAPSATVDFTMADGTHQRVDVICGLAIGGVSSDRACSDDPQISIYGGVSTDVPCGATPGDENHPCATKPPRPRAASIAASSPLILRTFDVVLDHVGHYEVRVGTASLPDGLLGERSGTLADSRPTTWWIDDGVQIVVRPGDPCLGARCQAIESIYHEPFDGPQPVNVYLVFDVTELDAPGAILEVRNLIVR